MDLEVLALEPKILALEPKVLALERALNTGNRSHKYWPSELHFSAGMLPESVQTFLKKNEKHRLK